jgi:hypothetical protein
MLLRWHVQASKGDLLLLSPSGKLLRTLASGIPTADFWPAWAIDGDQIAFIASESQDRKTGEFHHRVMRVDVSGHRSFLFSYASFEGCGGGSDDPSELAYWDEVGYEGDDPAIAWSLEQHLAAYQSGCGGGVNVTNTQTGATGSQRSWVDPALSSRGVLAVMQRSNGGRRTGPGNLLLVDPASGRVLHRPGIGELASWTRDGRTLYFVRRQVAHDLKAHDSAGNSIELTMYRSAIVQAWGNGSHQKTLLTADAYGFGPLNVLPGGASLIFSRIDNAWALWNARRNGVLPFNGVTRYPPAIQVERLDVGKGLVTLARNAGKPAVGA